MMAGQNYGFPLRCPLQHPSTNPVKFVGHATHLTAEADGQLVAMFDFDEIEVWRATVRQGQHLFCMFPCLLYSAFI